MEFIIIGIVSALNLIVIVHKFKKGRIEDGVFDSLLFVLLASLFAGSYAGMVVAMISSLIVSIYLWSSPPKFFRSIVKTEEVTSLVSSLKDINKLVKPIDSKSNSKPKKDIHFD